MQCQCLTCGSNRIELASVIVARETQNSTGSGRTNNGQFVTTNFTSQSARAQALTSDKPRRNGALGILLMVFMLLLPTIGVLYSCLNFLFLDYADVYIANADIQKAQYGTLLTVSILVFVAIFVVGIMVSRVKDKRFKVRYQTWLNRFYRRYYCHSCGGISQF
jgi:VIT1/CCC1 family predicted Fe2+/Mn2+ transporter